MIILERCPLAVWGEIPARRQLLCSQGPAVHQRFQHIGPRRIANEGAYFSEAYNMNHLEFSTYHFQT